MLSQWGFQTERNVQNSFATAFIVYVKGIQTLRPILIA
jgi:hypothetical protein